MIKTAIIGASGYTGFELIRILLAHPEAELVAVTSRQYKGMMVGEIFPALAGLTGLSFTDMDDLHAPDTICDVDLVFTALPHGASQEVVSQCAAKGIKVIDLSADFRLKEPDIYREWYGEHRACELLKEAVYGLPELHREQIKGAKVVANPGCYPTSAILGLAPLLRAGLIETNSILIDAKSGVSGAGRGANLSTSFVEVNDGFKAYSVGVHRHTPEIEQELSSLAGEGIKVSFTPHLLPVSRGILSTIYATLRQEMTTEALRSVYDDLYEDEPFVRLMGMDNFPDISQVRGSNYCDIGVKVDGRTGRVIIISVIDNLIKGASGQAVQNMNILYDLPEETGLATHPSPI
ncbi:MAG: N-acetyl-gamma-glutamyl-phosphate reductase [Thermodesulfobacteriota bacterium]